ncbi:MAG: DUF1559 domain-containing protein [Planctomyces sp.]|nr:DUF1559 domain-containing protein [Planctomyces sp.]
MLLTGLGRTREASRRVQCQSHMRQIMLACHAYHSVHQMFPPGNCYGFSLHSAILPQIDQGPLFQQIDFGANLGPDGPANEHIREQRIPLFLCPSDPASSAGGAGRTNYSGNAGIGVQCDGYRGIFQPLQNSGFRGQGPVSESQVVDGLSNTVALSELLIGDGSRHRLRTIWNVPDAYPACSQLDQFADACSRLDVSGQVGDDWGRGRSWLRGDNGNNLHNHISVPGEPSCNNRNWVPGGTFAVVSQHAGGVNVSRRTARAGL